MKTLKIEKLCEQYHIKDYTINDDGSIDVDGNVDLHNQIRSNKLPLKFRKVNGYFTCSHGMNPIDEHKLTTLKGAPIHVGSDFICESHLLTDLKYAPRYVGGRFKCRSNKLTSLKGAPTRIGSDFQCSFNNLTTLIDGPKYVGGYYDCYNNKLISLEGIAEYIGRTFNCTINNLTNFKGINNTIIKGDFVCDNNPLVTINNNLIISDLPKLIGGLFHYHHKYKIPGKLISKYPEILTDKNLQKILL